MVLPQASEWRTTLGDQGDGQQNAKTAPKWGRFHVSLSKNAAEDEIANLPTAARYRLLDIATLHCTGQNSSTTCLSQVVPSELKAPASQFPLTVKEA